MSTRDHPPATTSLASRSRPPVPSRSVAVLAGLLLALVVAAPAAAHADLVTSSPEDGAVLATPPTTITLTFSEPLDAGRSSFKLLAGGATVGTGKAAGGGADVMTLGPLLFDGRPLGPGVYQVQWTSVADDGDVLRGTLTFTVSEPTPAPATPAATSSSPEPSTTAPGPTAAPAPSAVPTPAPTGVPDPVSVGAGDVLLPIVATLALVAVIGVLVLRRGRRA